MDSVIGAAETRTLRLPYKNSFLKSKSKPTHSIMNASDSTYDHSAYTMYTFFLVPSMFL